MSHQITIADRGETVPAEPGETILDAMIQAGAAVSYSCQSGNCGTCKCEFVSGDIFELDYSEHALAAAERARGIILACRSQVWSDCVIRTIAAEELVVHPSRVMQCRVTEISDLTHDIKGVKLEIESGGPFTFSAGQYAQLEFAQLPPQFVRDFSMANRPEDPFLEFHVRHMPGGRASGYVAEKLKPSDRVKVSGPMGTSYLRENHGGRILAIAGGSGLAPIKSIVETALSQGATRPVYLYFGARAERDVYLEARLAELARNHPNFAYHIVLSEPQGNTSRRAGFVTDALAADFENLSGFKAYLAGPPVMVEAATDLLKQKGMETRDIHADAFYTVPGHHTK